MAAAKRIFLLPCAGCQQVIEVVAGQAGGQVVCGCGRPNDVPKLRELGGLPLKSAVPAGVERGWGLSQALMLAGLFSCLLAAAAGWWIGAVPESAVDPAITRANIDRGTDRQLYESLVNLAAASVDRPPLPEEMQLQRRERFATGMSRTLYALAALGALVAVVAALLRPSSPRESS
jgi:hypothetical protein